MNTLESTLTDIIARLRQGRFQNEQAVSQTECCTAESDETPSTCTATGTRCHGSRFRGSRGLPILRELGWDIFDTTLVWPEYQTGELESARGRGVRAATRADCCKRQQHLVGLGFAPCHPPSEPAIFIEVTPTRWIP